MSKELRAAHRANDKAVMQAYVFWGKLNSESECVAELMKMYEELTHKEWTSADRGDLFLSVLHACVY